MKEPILRRRAFGASVWLVPGLLSACDSTPKIPEEFLRSIPPGPTVMEGHHVGPAVTVGTTGPARYAAALHARFDAERAFEDVRFIDRFYRAPANDGYEAVLARIEARLAAGGFGTKSGFELEVLEAPLEARGWHSDGRIPALAWTPLGGKLALAGPGGFELVLHAFDDESAVDRVMLPVNTPSASVRAPIALGLEHLDPGEVLVTASAPTSSVLSRAHELGAVAVASSYLEPYNVDARGEWRELSAIQFGTVPYGVPIPVVRISPLSYLEIKNGHGRDPGVELVIETRVKLDERPLRTVCARVTGRDRPDEAIVIASHVQEPGACDNASGVAGLVESALALAAAIEAGEIERPSRTLVFLWGDEFRQTSTWLAQTTMKPIAGLSSDMTGESAEKTGAVALLERMPDPAALETLPPDEHTPWGARAVEASALRPNGLAIVARCALFDVAALDAAANAGTTDARPWKTAEHPYEGGSDHDILIERGIPAALFWHFTDFAYHTSLDRLDHVDPAELKRMAVAILSTASALADPRPEDLQRYLDSLNEELHVRTGAARTASDEELAREWREWFVGARHWLRTECLRLPPESSTKP
ncbi:MAG: M28 family peptidase [Planctomycetes bacterium]|nr:M28 family peptidase [Planctomycetota bacterium]